MQKPVEQCGSDATNTSTKKAAADDDNFDLFGSEDEEVLDRIRWRLWRPLSSYVYEPLYQGFVM